MEAHMFPRNFHHRTQPGPVAKLVYGMRVAMAVSAVMAAGTLLVVGYWRAEASDREQINRGKYLVTLGLCNDCHTPGYFFGKPDMTRYLGGSEVGFEMPGLGVFHGRNLTPDVETGIGSWSADDIVKAIQTGTRPDGRILAPIMPWHAFAELTKPDAQAIAAYLKSLPAVSNNVPGPFGPTETPTSFVFKIVPPPGAAKQ
jgi:mono/diheme cytochrome c family protein